jgi:hypothetical protein
MMDETVRDLYLLYLDQFSRAGWFKLFQSLRKFGVETALINSTVGFLVSDWLIDFLEHYLKE